MMVSLLQSCIKFVMQEKSVTLPALFVCRPSVPAHMQRCCLLNVSCLKICKCLIFSEQSSSQCSITYPQTDAGKYGSVFCIYDQHGPFFTPLCVVSTEQNRCIDYIDLLPICSCFTVVSMTCERVGPSSVMSHDGIRCCPPHAGTNLEQREIMFPWMLTQWHSCV